MKGSHLLASFAEFTGNASTMQQVVEPEVELGTKSPRWTRWLLRSPIQKLAAGLHKVKLIESPNNSCEVYCTELETGSVSAADSEPVLTRL